MFWQQIGHMPFTIGYDLAMINLDLAIAFSYMPPVRSQLWPFWPENHVRKQ